MQIYKYDQCLVGKIQRILLMNSVISRLSYK